MKTAVNAFIDNVAQKNKDTKGNTVGHRISIVKFAGNKSTEIGDDTYTEESGIWPFIETNTYNYSQIVKNLTAVNDAGKVALQTAVNALQPAGATRADYGMELAKKELENNSKDQSRDKVVVMFTDGSPNSSNGFEYDVASDAISASKALKDKDVKVYTIGIFSGANPKEEVTKNKTSAENKYMHAVSSNYPHATLDWKQTGHFSGEWQWNFGRRAEGSNCYLSATNSTELNDVFTEISDSITTTHVTANESAVLRDTLTDQFVLNGTDASAITVKKAEVKGKDGNAYTWKTPVDVTGITKDISRDGKTVTVKGFDYTSTGTTGNVITKNGNDYSGYKLIVTIPIKVNQDYTGWKAGTKNYDTNVTDTEDNKAGLTGYKKGEEPASTLLDTSPQVPVTAYKVTYEWGDIKNATTVTDNQYYINGQTAQVKGTVQEGTAVQGNNGQWYRFSSWSLDGETVIKSVAITNNNVTLKPVLTEAYTVTYTGEGATGGNAPTDMQSPYSAGSTVTVLTEQGTLEKTGHTFAGWATNDANVTETSSTFTMPAQDVVFDPVWQVERYTVTINYVYKDYTTAANSVSITDDYDATYSKTSPTITGYKPDQETVSGKIPLGGTTVTVIYSKDDAQTTTLTYTVRHVVDGEVKDTDTYTEPVWAGETNPQITIQTGSLKENDYTGYKLDSITENLKEGDSVASGKVITLTYVKDENQTQKTRYTVQHVLIPRVGERTVHATKEYFGTDWINATNPTVEVTAESIKPLEIGGYTYQSISPEGVQAGSRVSNEATIILYYMDLNSNKYSVTYQGEAVTNSTTYHDKDAPINILQEPPRNDYLFDGWECNLDHQIYQAGAPYTVTQDVVFTAKWTPIKKEIEISKALTKVNGNDYQTGTVSIDDVLTYSVTVVNKGNVDLPSVVIHDSLVGDITFANIQKNTPTGVTKTYHYTVPADAGESVKNAVVAKDKETIKDNGGDEVTVPVAKRYTVTTSIDSHGTITPTTTYDEGKDATVSFTITGNYRINSVTVDGAAYQNYAWSNTDNAYIIKFEKIAKNHTVAVTTKAPGGGGGGGGSNRPKPPVVEIPDDVPTGLNGKDHYAYVVGYPDGMVYPQKNITRAEVATIFFRLLKDETREANMTKSNGYNDMKDGAWYTCAVSTLSKMGIIKGYEDGSFKPDASISRAEFAAIAARFDPDGDKTPATFSDVSSHWAKDEISIAANHGWIKGYEDGSFKPDQKITRAETMTLVNRVLKRLPETKDDLHKDMKTWPDNQNESAWFYLAVQEATNSHYQKLKKDGTHEKWESMRETRDWAALEK